MVFHLEKLIYREMIIIKDLYILFFLSPLDWWFNIIFW